MFNYRDRIYKYYDTARDQALIPKNTQGLMPRAPIFRNIINKYFPADRSAVILDLGCGHGAFLYFIQKAGYDRAVGIDCSPQQVVAAKNLGIRGVHEGNLIDTLKKIPSESQDVIISFDIIEHFAKEEIIEFTDEVYRVLRKNGNWILHTPNGESPFVSRILYGDFTHEYAFTKTSISQLLLSSGFNHLSFQEDYPIPHGITSAVRFVLWQIIRTALRLYTLVETGSLEKQPIYSQCFLTVAKK